jgi:phosphohistidine phosphatase
MRQLTLVRHAKAQVAQPNQADFDRPLNDRGKAEAAAMAARARDLDLTPDFLVASPAARTLATARAFARAFRIPMPNVVRDDRLYLAGPDALMSVLRRVPRHCQHVLMVGHNPGLSEFAVRLTGDEHLRDLPTCAVCSLQLDCNSWAAAAWRYAERVLYDWPGSLTEEW